MKTILIILIYFFTLPSQAAELNIYGGIGSPIFENDDNFATRDVGYLSIEIKHYQKWTGVFYKAEHRSKLSTNRDKGSNLFIFGGFVSLLSKQYLLADEFNIYLGMGTPIGEADPEYKGFDVGYMAAEFKKSFNGFGVFYKIERRSKLSEDKNGNSDLFVMGGYLSFDL